MSIEATRIYDEIAGDYYRVLVDGIWPRGFKKSTPKIDTWLKEIAPSTELRKWYGHEEDKEAGFTKKYRAEIEQNTEAVKELKKIISEHTNVALVYAAKSPVNNATVLRDWLKDSN